MHDETTFYQHFCRDLLHASREVVIERPFITSERMAMIYPIFERLVARGVKLFVITRDPQEHSETMVIQSEDEIQRLEALGVQVYLCTGNHHRKLAFIDRKILWEGSLNILSQNKSREIMRRIDDEKSAVEMLTFLRLERYL